MEDPDGRPHVPRRVGLLKKKKVHHMGMGEPAVPVVAPRFGVLKKKKKVIEVDDSAIVAAPRFGVLKKRKVIKPARPKLVLPGVSYKPACPLDYFLYPCTGEVSANCEVFVVKIRECTVCSRRFSYGIRRRGQCARASRRSGSFGES